jgi:hypothetical protein
MRKNILRVAPQWDSRSGSRTTQKGPRRGGHEGNLCGGRQLRLNLGWQLSRTLAPPSPFGCHLAGLGKAGWCLPPTELAPAIMLCCVPSYNLIVFLPDC